MSDGLVNTGRLVRGQRRCMHCDYGFRNQPVMHDVADDLLLVRCPECGRCGSVGNDSLLGRRARPLIVVLMVAFTLVVASIWLVSNIALSSHCRLAGELAAERYTTHLLDEFATAMESAEGEQILQQTLAAGGATQAARAKASSFATWWAVQDHDAALASAGGILRATSWQAAIMWIPAGVLGFICGVFWSVLLSERRWPARLASAALIIAPAAVLVVQQVVRWEEPWMVWAGGVARASVAPTMAWVTLLVGLLAVLAGLAVGPRLARAMLHSTLSPRARRPFSRLGVRHA